MSFLVYKGADWECSKKRMGHCEGSSLITCGGSKLKNSGLVPAPALNPISSSSGNANSIYLLTGFSTSDFFSKSGIIQHRNKNDLFVLPENNGGRRDWSPKKSGPPARTDIRVAT